MSPEQLLTHASLHPCLVVLFSLRGIIIYLFLYLFIFVSLIIFVHLADIIIIYVSLFFSLFICIINYFRSCRIVENGDMSGHGLRLLLHKRNAITFEQVCMYEWLAGWLLG